MSLVDEAAEAPDRETSDAALDDVMRRLTEWGVTSIHNMTGWEQLLILRRARSTGRLRVRVYAAITPLESWRRLVEYTSVNGQGDEWLRWSAMKGYARDWPDSGAGTNPPPAESVPGETTIEQFYEWVAAASRAGLPILVHDGGGVRQVLDVFARVRAEQQIADPRFRMEHSFFVTPLDAKRFAALGVIGSLQPDLAFTFDDPVEFQDHLPYRALLDSGARVAFGSDQIAAPLAGIALAMTHPIAAGPVMTVEEALRAYTSDAAYAAFEEKDKGTLEPGKLADFVILDQDITRVAPNQIRAARVVVTVVGGRIVNHGTKPRVTGGTPDGTLAPNEWRQ
jgi:predicted amidohydrolase YtcJ